MHQYAVKVLCGDPVRLGSDALLPHWTIHNTLINLLNTGRHRIRIVRKTYVIQEFYTVPRRDEFEHTILRPRRAVVRGHSVKTFSCSDLATFDEASGDDGIEFHEFNNDFLKAIVVIRSCKPLDVTAVYSEDSGNYHNNVDVEQIIGRKVWTRGNLCGRNGNGFPQGPDS